MFQNHHWTKHRLVFYVLPTKITISFNVPGTKMLILFYISFKLNLSSSSLSHIISYQHIIYLYYVYYCILCFDSNYSVIGDGKEDKLIKTIKGIRISPVFKISYVSDVTISLLTLCGLFDDRSSLEQCKDFNIWRWASLARINPPGLYICRTHNNLGNITQLLSCQDPEPTLSSRPGDPKLLHI